MKIIQRIIFYLKAGFLFSSLLFAQLLMSQSSPFKVSLEEVVIPELGGIQSYAFGRHEGQWLIVGGRLDGLHRRQPFAAFDLAGHNNRLVVIDPEHKQKWSASITSLPASIQAQLSSTNMEFIQVGIYLYVIGGYGYSPAIGDHTTYAFLTAIHVEKVIEAVQEGKEITPYFRQIEDNNFQVTGGSLKMIEDTFYLLGGQKFLGRYNPMGPNHGPGFIQEYTNEVRRFHLSDDGSTIKITHLPAFRDAEKLHRRDYNAESQIMPDGSQGITMFSGVFRPNVDLPFLDAVNVDKNGYSVQQGFEQYYNHYHCASIPLFSTEHKEMHTLFFGGIAQYYENKGKLVKDDNAPFVKTIARLTRDSLGVMREFKLTQEMPALLGAGSEFIPVNELPVFANGVLDLDALPEEKSLIGYIFGGISSTAANIFFTNDGSQSKASPTIFKVFLENTHGSGTDVLNVYSARNIALEVFPNPNSGQFVIRYYLHSNEDVVLSIVDESGKNLLHQSLKKQAIGENTYTADLSDNLTKGIYFVTILTTNGSGSAKVIIR
ncbi:MAG: T9SS type A sorting domain-containing protein [Saprospiraceae bacterium]|nr:T9SS type A sorting domain-containing protein [Saprospiraceae bacterium]